MSVRVAAKVLEGLGNINVDITYQPPLVAVMILVVRELALGGLGITLLAVEEIVIVVGVVVLLTDG